MSPPPVEISRLREAQRRWSREPLSRRLQLVRRLRHLIGTHAGTLAQASATARGRPLAESLTAEVMPLAEACRFLERNAAGILKTQRLGRRGRPIWLGGVRSEIHRDPLGVVLIIGPGNYPLFLPGVQLIQALAAGNAAILKPGKGGLPAAAALVELIHRAGFDPALIQLLPESVAAADAAIDALPDKLIFTGSAAAASQILARLAPLMIPAVIEASGCDAAIVRADADLKLTVAALVFSLTLNAGATCMAPKRILVHRDLAAELGRRLASALQAHGNFPVSLPRHHQQEIERAIAAGAEQLTDGPILLDRVPADSPLWQADVFGAFALLDTFASDEEAVSRTNDCPFALAASIFSRDESAAGDLARQLSVGLVTINELIVSSADARLPFGGRRRSGYGSTRGAAGLLEMTVPKAVSRSRSRFRPAYQPAAPRDTSLFLTYLRLTHALGLRKRFKSS